MAAEMAKAARPQGASREAAAPPADLVALVRELQEADHLRRNGERAARSVSSYSAKSDAIVSSNYQRYKDALCRVLAYQPKAEEPQGATREAVPSATEAKRFVDTQAADSNARALPTSATIAALREYVSEHGPMEHDEGCPEDDTCSCSVEPTHRAVNDLCLFDPDPIAEVMDCARAWLLAYKAIGFRYRLRGPDYVEAEANLVAALSRVVGS